MGAPFADMKQVSLMLDEEKRDPDGSALEELKSKIRVSVTEDGGQRRLQHVIDACAVLSDERKCRLVELLNGVAEEMWMYIPRKIWSKAAHLAEGELSCIVDDEKRTIFDAVQNLTSSRESRGLECGLLHKADLALRLHGAMHHCVYLAILVVSQRKDGSLATFVLLHVGSTFDLVRWKRQNRKSFRSDWMKEVTDEEDSVYNFYLENADYDDWDLIESTNDEHRVSTTVPETWLETPLDGDDYEVGDVHPPSFMMSAVLGRISRYKRVLGAYAFSPPELIEWLIEEGLVDKAEEHDEIVQLWPTKEKMIQSC